MPRRCKPRIIYNDDAASLSNVALPHTVEKVGAAVDHLRDTQVDCLCWLVAEEVAYSYMSDVIENSYDLARAAGLPISPTNLRIGLHEKGIDYLPFLIRRTRDNGMAFFASFRMNDTHFKSRPNGPLATEFWKTHQHWRLWEVTAGKTYYNAALDYSHPEVRQRKLDAIEEVAQRYDVDGIELDFSRNPYTFQPSEAWSKRAILTRFIRDVRAILTRIGEGKGRRIDLLVRVPFSEQRLRNAGMHVREWVRQGDMDILVMTCLQNDCRQKVEPWLGLCREHGIPFYPSLEAGPATYDGYFDRVISNPTAPNHNYVVHQSMDVDGPRQLRGSAQNFLAQGVDGIYMFNHPCARNERSGLTAEMIRKHYEPLAELGSLRTLRGTAKQYTFWRDLPIAVESNRPPQYHQTINFMVLDPDIRAKKTKTVLMFRQVAERTPHAPEKYRQNPIVPRGMIRYLVNGREIDETHVKRTKAPRGRIPSGFKLRTHEIIEIDVPTGALKAGDNSLAFHIPKPPEERDPYVYIYELTIEVLPAG